MFTVIIAFLVSVLSWVCVGVAIGKKNDIVVWVACAVGTTFSVATFSGIASFVEEKNLVESTSVAVRMNDVLVKTPVGGDVAILLQGVKISETQVGSLRMYSLTGGELTSGQVTLSVVPPKEQKETGASYPFSPTPQ